MRIGRFLQGLIVLSWGFMELGLQFWSLATVIVIISFVSTTALFYGLFVVQATLSFWTVETLELMNIATYGGMEASQFPMSIYTQPFRLFFTAVIPLACVGYYPIAVLLHHEAMPLWVGMLLPTGGLIFLFLACQFWKVGVRHYHSTGN